MSASQGELFVDALQRAMNAMRRRVETLERKMGQALVGSYGNGSGGGGLNVTFTLAVTGGSAIAAGSATVPTSGTVTLRTFSGGTLSASTETVTAFNYHDKIINAGSLVALSYGLNAWWIIDVRSCTNLT